VAYSRLNESCCIDHFKTVAKNECFIPQLRSSLIVLHDDAHGDGVHNSQRSGGQSVVSAAERHAAVLASTRAAGRTQLRRADVFISDSSSPSGGGSSAGREFESIDPVSGTYFD
jgi:hypothetical protein